jgi:hypothetical protein
MADVEPVVVPVVLRAPDTSALDMLGEKARKVNETAGAIPGAGVGGDGGAVVRGIAREFSGLEKTVQALNAALERLAKNVPAIGGGGAVDGAGGGGPAPTPEADAGTPASPGRGRTPRAPTDDQLARFLQEAVVGIGGAAGIGFGMSKVYSEVGKYVSTAKDFGLGVHAATLAVGGNARDYAALEQALTGDGIESRLGFRPLSDPMEQARIAGKLGSMGVPLPRGAVDAALLGEVGKRAMGSADAGGQVGAEAYRTFRSDLVTEYLGTLVQQGASSGKNIGELVTQFSGLSGLLRSRQGQYERSRAEMTGLLNLQTQLDGLPGGIGKGQGGVELASALADFGTKGGIGSAFTQMAYERATGRGAPGNLQEVLQRDLWARDPKNMFEKAYEIQKRAGPAAGAYILSDETGLPLEVAARLMSEPITKARVDDILSKEAIGKGFGAQNEDLGTTPGGQSADTAATGGRNLSKEGWLPWLGRKYERGWATHFNEMALGHTAATAYVGKKGLSALLARRAATAALTGGGTTAAGVGGAAAGGTLAFLRRFLGPLGGLYAAGQDAYDAYAGGDSNNSLDILLGLGGAVIGGIAGIPAGPAGIAGGALYGYGLGNLVSGGLGLANDALTSSGLLNGDGPALPSRGPVNLHDPAFRAAEAKYGLPPGVLSAIAQQETGGRPWPGPPIRSMGGMRAQGLMQFIPPTAARFGIDPNDNNQSLDGAARYVRELLGQTGGDLEAALNLYGGDKTAKKYGREVKGRMAAFGGADGDDNGMSIDYGTMPDDGGRVITLLVHAPGLRVAGGGDGVTVRQIE